jgi:hypothetical protein
MNIYVLYATEKSRTKMWATSVIFKKLPIINKRTLGENCTQIGHPVYEGLSQQMCFSKTFLCEPLHYLGPMLSLGGFSSPLKKIV